MGHNSAVSQPFEVTFFYDFLHQEDLISFKSQVSEAHEEN